MDEQDALDAAWNQAEQDERRRREEAAIARCRPLTDELRAMFTNGDKCDGHESVRWQ